MVEENYMETQDFDSSGNAAVMKNFFDVQLYIKKKIAYWQGFSIINGKKVETHEPIAPDGFIFSLIGIIDSIVSQHNSVSYTKTEAAEKILYESFTAFNQSVLNEPLFNTNRYDLLKEEVDHMIELFMGLVINGHGKLVATALQAGVIGETQLPEQKGAVESVKDKIRNIIE